MNILFVSEDLVAGNLAYLLQKEGHQVKLYIKDIRRRANFTNIVPKITDWRKELNWVGEEGLIIFDSCSHGKLQDNLRNKGYSVVGGCFIADKMEHDRKFAMDILSIHGIETVPLLNFETIDDAISFIKNEKGKWVIKQNIMGTGSKGFNYVGMFQDGLDVVDMLENYKKETKYKGNVITLQKRIDGIEIGAGRYFNGSDWVGPIEINIEHKKLFPGDLGPSTSEMGTIAWFDDNENNKLFQKTLNRIKPFLKEINFRGDIDINCIVNEEGVFPLEVTPRFGSPIIHLQTVIHKSPWGEFLKAVADGKPYKLRWNNGYGIVIVVTVPTSHPFPFTKEDRYVSPKGMKIYFNQNMRGNDFKHIHFEDISMNDKNEYYISDDRGYVLYVTSLGSSIEEAREKVYKIIEKIYIPKMFYRNDIGLKFIQSDKTQLIKWGYL